MDSYNINTRKFHTDIEILSKYLLLSRMSMHYKGYTSCAVKTSDLSSVPGTHVVEKENPFLQVVL